jgi:hypothetical protein
MRGRRPRKPRGGVSRSGCRRIAWIMTISPIRGEIPCWPEVLDQ